MPPNLVLGAWEGVFSAVFVRQLLCWGLLDVPHPGPLVLPNSACLFLCMRCINYISQPYILISLMTSTTLLPPWQTPYVSQWISFSYDPGTLQAVPSMLELRASGLCANPSRIKSWFPTALQFSWTQAPLVFKPRHYGAFFFQFRSPGWQRWGNKNAVLLECTQT